MLSLRQHFGENYFNWRLTRGKHVICSWENYGKTHQFPLDDVCFILTIKKLLKAVKNNSLVSITELRKDLRYLLNF